MLSSEDANLYEVTCVDCNTTKSYFTAQGVSYFKLNHDGHKIRVKEPMHAEEPKEEPLPPPKIKISREEPVPEPVELTVEAAGEEDFSEPPETVYEAPVHQVLAEDRVNLGNLVVDVVDEGAGRGVKVFGIANGHERFTKEFDIHKIDELNSFLESGVYHDDATKMTYAWTPDKVDLSMDVAKMIEEPPVPTQVVAEPAAPAPKVEDVRAPEQEVPPVEEKPQAALTATVKSPGTQASEDVLLGKRSYIQEGDERWQECVRVSGVLRKFRWNTEPPYVIGAMFDDLMCVQSQTGMIKSSLIEEVKKLGYVFVAIEAPGGIVSAWFKRAEAGAEAVDETLEFH